MLELLQLLVGGILQGCVYGLIALGFVLIYKATEMVNFAQGDLTQDCLARACPSMVLAGPANPVSLCFADGSSSSCLCRGRDAP